jgi:hypothetical protein
MVDVGATGASFSESEESKSDDSSLAFGAGFEILLFCKSQIISEHAE